MNEDIPRKTLGGIDTSASPGRAGGGGEGGGPLAEPAGDDADLRVSMAGLSQLANGQMDLREALTRVAELAVVAIPGADGVGLTLSEAGNVDTIVASTQFVSDVDAVQYDIGEGPCISAAGEVRTVRAAELATDPQWPAFAPQIAHLGVHSALSLPLITPSGVVGAMNVYAHAPNAFDEQAAYLGELFAVPAAIAVQNAQILARARRLAEDLQIAVDRRSAIDQATGILMSCDKCSPGEALEQLQLISGRANETLHAAASRVIEDAAQRARTGPANS